MKAEIKHLRVALVMALWPELVTADFLDAKQLMSKLGGNAAIA
jgi:hypothetical protein